MDWGVPAQSVDGGPANVLRKGNRLPRQWKVVDPQREAVLTTCPAA
jgi:hypothetical protein